MKALMHFQLRGRVQNEGCRSIEGVEIRTDVALYWDSDDYNGLLLCRVLPWLDRYADFMAVQHWTRVPEYFFLTKRGRSEWIGEPEPKKLNNYLHFNKTSLKTRLKLYIFMKSVSLLWCIIWKRRMTTDWGIRENRAPVSGFRRTRSKGISGLVVTTILVWGPR